MRCVLARDFTVAKLLAWRSAMQERPPYQRESSVWSLDKQQLFIDSLLNGYDVPKLYLHDLRGRHPTKVYSVVDGKQRLTTIWDFLTDRFPLAADFKVEQANLPELPAGTTHPAAGARFSQLHPAWRRVLQTTSLAVVLIQNATAEDIEELFSRLNNGEPLNAAEKRNARGGELARLIRELALRPFFTERLRFGNGRYHHLDLAARLLLIERAQAGAPGAVPDLSSRALDQFVLANRTLGAAEGRALLERVERRLDYLCQVFGPADPLLATQSWPPLYYLLVTAIAPGGGAPSWPPGTVRGFLEWFQAARRAELERPEERQDPALAEFTRLMQHGANDRRGLQRRLRILSDRFLERHPEPAPHARAAAGPRTV